MKNSFTNATLSNIAKLCFTHLQITVKQSTVATYRGIYSSYIDPELGNKNIITIKSQDFDQLIHKLSYDNGLSSRTLCLAATVLRHCFRYANSIGINAIDPSYIKRPKAKKQNTEILTDDEYRTLINYCTSMHSTSTLGILLTLYTGLRIGELCALQWGDIDALTKTLNVRRTVLRINNTIPNNCIENTAPKTRLIIDSPKSAASTRCIPIPECLWDLLESYRKNDNVYILSGTQKFYEPRYFRKLYYQILDKAMIKHYSYHALRHTFATNCVNLGFNPKVLSEILGHSDVSITFNTYIHTSLEAMRRDMGKFTLD